jgi:hypothetical protein
MSFTRTYDVDLHCIKSINPECRIIGVTTRMVDYDLAVKLTSGLFRSWRGWRRPDSTVHIQSCH